MERLARGHRLVLWARIFFLALLGLTIYGSVAPPGDVAPVFVVPDKIVHGAAYAVLAFLLAASLSGRIVLAALGMLAIGGGLEVVQAWLGYRSGDWGDMAADAIGILLGLLVYRLASSAAR